MHKQTHYPSWGLETEQLEDVSIASMYVLITPHGDWKLAGDFVRQQVVGLITPHGDWKP